MIECREPETGVADYIADHLSAAGLTHVFGVSGANIEDLFLAVERQAGLTAILAKHEFSAGTMADGFARTSNRPAVVLTTSGGAALNLVAALGEAYSSRVPMVALVGQPPTGLNGKGAFQDSSGENGSIDAHALFSTVSRYCATVTESHLIPKLLAEALATARGEPAGPAVLLLPKDVQQAVLRSPDVSRPVTSQPVAVHSVTPSHANSADVRRAVRFTAEARESGQVLIIAGDGVARASARAELARLADVLDARVAVTPDGKDVFDNHDRRFCGVAGIMGNPNVERCLRKASACVLVGTRLPDVAKGGLDGIGGRIPVLCLDREPPFVEGVHLRGEVRSTLDALVRELGALSAPTAVVAEPLDPLPTPSHTGRGADYAELVSVLAEVLPRDANVFVDAGNCGAAVIHRLAVPRDGRFVVALGMGGMGYTFGAGIGAALAHPGKRTYVVAGDGAFYTHGLEIHTAVEYDLPVTFIVLDNNAHAMCVTREELFHGGEYTRNRFRGSRLAAGVAAMFPTLRARHADTADEFRAALADDDRVGPAFIGVSCDADQIPPFVPFLSKENANVHAG